MEFLPPEINAYSQDFSSPESEVLKELNRETQHKVLQPRMLSGHLQGRVLSMLSHMIGPKRILEVGTYTGYAAICMAEGLASDGHLHTIDHNEELEDMANDYFEKAGFKDRITMHIGDALEVIPQLNESWDLVFIDADKENYRRYYDQVIKQMNAGSYIIADNVLWSGKVLKDPDANDDETLALQEFNDHVQNDDRVENVLLPIRDGLMVCRKL